MNCWVVTLLITGILIAAGISAGLFYGYSRNSVWNGRSVATSCIALNYSIALIECPEYSPGNRKRGTEDPCHTGLVLFNYGNGLYTEWKIVVSIVSGADNTIKRLKIDFPIGGSQECWYDSDNPKDFSLYLLSPGALLGSAIVFAIIAVVFAGVIVLLKIRESKHRSDYVPMQ